MCTNCYDSGQSTWLGLLGTFAVGLVLVAGVLAAAADALSLPTVYEDAVSGKCRYVEEWGSHPGRFSCKRLPAKYERVAVDPSWQPPVYLNR